MDISEELEYIKRNIDIKRFENKKVLLIGANGFIGKWLSDFFNYYDIEYYCLDNNICSLNDGKSLVHDICDSIPFEKKYDFIINCAGIASPTFYMKWPIKTLDVSYIGTKNVLDYATRVGAESVVMFSSSEVYGTPPEENIPTREDFIGQIPSMSSRSCYDIGKLVLESLCHSYYLKHEIPVKIIRPFNFYGPHMNPNDGRVLSNWLKNYLNSEKIEVYGDGEQTRTFCYIADGILGILKVLLDGKDGDVYNVGNPEPELNMKELANHINVCLEDQLNVDLTAYPENYPSDEPRRRCPNISKISKELGYRPNYDLCYGIKRMLEYYKSLEIGK